jgi:hypothetical protein
LRRRGSGERQQRGRGVLATLCQSTKHIKAGTPHPKHPNPPNKDIRGHRPRFRARRHVGAPPPPLPGRRGPLPAAPIRPARGRPAAGGCGPRAPSPGACNKGEGRAFHPSSGQTPLTGPAGPLWIPQVDRIPPNPLPASHPGIAN